MAKIVNPLTFFIVDGKLEARFPLLSSPVDTEGGDRSHDEGTVVWPPEGSGEIELIGSVLKLGVRAS